MVIIVGSKYKRGRELSRLSTVSKALFSPEFDLWISLSNRHHAMEFSGRLERRLDQVSCGHFRAVPTARISSFIRHGAVSYVHAHTEYSGIHDITGRNKNERKGTHLARDVSSVFIFYSYRFFNCMRLTLLR